MMAEADPKPNPKPSDPPPSFQAAPPDAVVRFGRYELIGELASGGMGAVYLARVAAEAGFQRLFALKIMHEHLAKDEAFVEMLLDEARLTSGIHHPNVVPIVDLGNHKGRYFLVMDYVEGCSLSQLCTRHRTARDPAVLIPLVIDALEGLHAAHTLVDDEDRPLNLVHRDVSSQNIMIGVDGVARVVDFGIAKAEARITSTRPGTLKGKIALMSPEQLRGADVDARSDVFSAGAMLWSLLTASRLFAGDSQIATMTNILSKEVPPPSTVGLKPPACFDAICLRAMQRDPAARYQSAAEMANGLRKVAVENGYMASRADIAAWVKGSFKKEFAARREAVRKRATEVAVTISDVQDLPSLPSLAGLSSPSLSGVRGSSTGDSGSLSSPAEPTKAFSSPQVEAPKQAGSRSKVAIAVAAIAGMAVAAVAIVVLNRAQRPSATPAVVAEAPAKVETVTTPQPNAKVEPTPSVVPPTPTVVPEASQAKPVAAPTTAPRAPRPAAPTKATATASASVAPAVAAPPPPPQPVVKKPVDLDSPDLPQ